MSQIAQSLDRLPNIRFPDLLRDWTICREIAQCRLIAQSFMSQEQ